MTKVPVTITPHTPLVQVYELMQRFKVRHLPVQDGPLLLGYLTEKKVRESLADRNGEVLVAKEIMVKDPFTVHPEMNLDEVAAQMAEEKYSCALVEDDEGKLIGIFTTVDACRALRQVLEDCYAV